jgi:hypothetical protein
MYKCERCKKPKQRAWGKSPHALGFGFILCAEHSASEPRRSNRNVPWRWKWCVWWVCRLSEREHSVKRAEYHTIKNIFEVDAGRCFKIFICFEFICAQKTVTSPRDLWHTVLKSSYKCDIIILKCGMKWQESALALKVVRLIVMSTFKEKYSSFGGTRAMTLGGAALTSVEKNSRPQLMSQRTSCKHSVKRAENNTMRNEFELVTGRCFKVFIWTYLCNRLWPAPMVCGT